METMNLEYESECKMRRLKSPIIANNRQTRPEPRASNAWYMFTLKMQSLILKNAETVSRGRNVGCPGSRRHSTFFMGTQHCILNSRQGTLLQMPGIQVTLGELKFKQ